MLKLLLVLCNLSFNATAVPSSLELNQPPPVSFASTVENWKRQLESQPLNDAECLGTLKSLRQQITEENLTFMRDSEVSTSAENIMQALWTIRLTLHDQLQFSPNCREEIYITFQQLRGVDDLLGDKYYAEPALNPDQVDFSKQPIPMWDNEFYHGYRARPSLAGKDFALQSGDILLSRGISFFGAALTRVPQPVGEFSHMALIHRDDQDVVHMMESFPQTNGVVIYPQIPALRHENVRLIFLRPKDRSLGKAASDWMWEEIKKRKIPYDYQMDTEDDSKMVCSEVPYHAYKAASNGQVLLPEYQSRIVSPNLLKLMKELGASSDHVLNPNDIEADSRFELLTEFKDYRLIRDSRYRDAILSQVYYWFDTRGYQFYDDGNTFLANHFIWPLRRTLLMPLLKALGVEIEIPEGIPKRPFITMARVNEIAEMIYPELKKLDEHHFLKTGWPMTIKQMQQAVEVVHDEDLDNYLTGRGQTFHMLFHSKKQWPLPVNGGG